MCLWYSDFMGEVIRKKMPIKGSLGGDNGKKKRLNSTTLKEIF